MITNIAKPVADVNHCIFLSNTRFKVTNAIETQAVSSNSSFLRVLLENFMLVCIFPNIIGLQPGSNFIESLSMNRAIDISNTESDGIDLQSTTGIIAIFCVQINGLRHFSFVLSSCVIFSGEETFWHAQPTAKIFVFASKPRLCAFDQFFFLLW